jgi:small conductance mechanosensitive channel
MQQFIRGVTSRLQQEFDPEILGETLALFISNLLVGLLIFFAFYVVWRVLDYVLTGVFQRTRLDDTTSSFIQTVLRFIVLALGVVEALSAMGVNTGAILASLGVAGLTVGFAARDALSNLISGILIFWDRPFVIDDLVEVKDQYGRVERITLRSTRVVTPDGRMLAVPNTTIINSTVASYTNFPHLRLDVSVNIGVEEDIERVRHEMLDLVRDHPSFVDSPEPRVVLTALNDYNLELQMQAWIHDEREHVIERHALREQLHDTLSAAGVDMPYETLSLTPVEVHERGQTA